MNPMFRMKLISKQALLFSIFFCLGIVSCSKAKFDPSYVRSASWQWDMGYKIGDGDFIDFDTSGFYVLSHDTILRKGIPKCVILAVDTSLFEMQVRSFEGDLGYYHNTAESLR